MERTDITPATISPYTYGQIAFQSKTLKLSENPYKGTQWEIQWENGWNAAQDEVAEDWANEQISKNK